MHKKINSKKTELNRHKAEPQCLHIKKVSFRRIVQKRMSKRKQKCYKTNTQTPHWTHTESNTQKVLQSKTIMDAHTQTSKQSRVGLHPNMQTDK